MDAVNALRLSVFLLGVVVGLLFREREREKKKR